MTLQQYSDNLQNLHGLQDSIVNLVIAPNGIKLLLSVINRIQKQGKATSGGEIGAYSTKPAYFGQAAFVNSSAFRPQGKQERNKPVKELGQTKLTKVKIGGKNQAVRNVKGFNAELRKTMYLPHGYKELRQIQGLETQHVNETYSGQTMAAYRAEIEGQAMLIGFTTDRASKIRRGQEKHFKQPIFSPTMTEIQVYKDAVTNRLGILTRNTITGVNPVATVG